MQLQDKIQAHIPILGPPILPWNSLEETKELAVLGQYWMMNWGHATWNSWSWQQRLIHRWTTDQEGWGWAGSDNMAPP